MTPERRTMLNYTKSYKLVLRRCIHQMKAAMSSLEEGAEGETRKRNIATINRLHPKIVELKGRIEYLTQSEARYQYASFKATHIREDEQGNQHLVHQPFKALLK